MPLVDPSGDEPTNLTCACGTETGNWQSHWLHAIRECPLTRCATCFVVLDEFYNPEPEHVCPSLKLTRLKLEIRKLINNES